uniref:WDR5-like beta-propeller domain-containing protein n=1 Tax=Timspurckia oligopyrenoides TaxID=708627 RepID=A0A7S0ZDE2_9RHOD|mmetsp:Transcript_13373/g.23994  ORF Transcript_13373/g.23994 Transcript_13373/m.23994 type:complete len:364 (+) Transcript_13373:22-1113(+)
MMDNEYLSNSNGALPNGHANGISSDFNYECKLTLEGHKKAVSSVKFASVHDSLLCSASADKTIKLWDMYKTESIQTLGSHSQGISDVSWSHDDRFLCSASDDRLVKIWDTEKSQVVYKFRGHKNYVFCSTFSPFSNLCASGSYDETVRIWDIRSGMCIRTLPAHADPVSSVSFSPDGTILLTSGYDGYCRLWDVPTGRCLSTIVASGEGHNPPVGFARFTPNGRFILVSTLDDSVRLWDYSSLSGNSNVAGSNRRRNGRVMKTYRGHKNSRFCMFNSFITVGNIKCVVSGSEDNFVYIWNLQTRQVIQKLEGHCDVVLTVAAHSKLPVIASGSLEKDKSIKIWKDASRSDNSTFHSSLINQQN